MLCLHLTISAVNAEEKNEVSSKKIVFTDKAPKPIGPYSQAVIAGDYIFLSGQIALDTNGKMISGTAAEETKLIMQNIKAVLQEAGTELSDIVKTSIFLIDLNEFAKVNEVYGSFFVGEYPARETVQVAALPKGAKVEISVIAYKPKNKLHKRK
jgi:2-iminobutanoate/2-iminopropanoate deaminase